MRRAPPKSPRSSTLFPCPTLFRSADVTRDGEHASVQLDGRGRDGGMVLKTLRATTPSGTLDARGDIAWQPATGWKLDATLDGFDPGYFAAGWAGDIDGTIATRGRTLDGGGFDATLSVPTLTGTLRGRTLDGKAELTAQGGTYRGHTNPPPATRQNGQAQG